MTYPCHHKITANACHVWTDERATLADIDRFLRILKAFGAVPLYQGTNQYRLTPVRGFKARLLYDGGWSWTPHSDYEHRYTHPYHPGRTFNTSEAIEMAKQMKQHETKTEKAV